MGRRRFLNDGYVDWLKSIGCVLYLPLSQEGDLTDRISGKDLILSGNGSMVWDSSENMYLITQPNIRWRYVASLMNDLNSSWFPEGNYSTCHQIKRVTNDSTKFITAGPSPITNTSEDTVYAIGAYYNASGRTSGFPQSLAKVAYVSNGTTNRTYYQNGSAYGSYSAYSAYFPSNWQQTEQGVAIGIMSNSNRSRVSYYGKEYYIFNKVLDIETIRKIQGYE